MQQNILGLSLWCFRLPVAVRQVHPKCFSRGQTSTNFIASTLIYSVPLRIYLLSEMTVKFIVIEKRNSLNHLRTFKTYLSDRLSLAAATTWSPREASQKRLSGQSDFLLLQVQCACEEFASIIYKYIQTSKMSFFNWQRQNTRYFSWTYPCAG